MAWRGEVRWGLDGLGDVDVKQGDATRWIFNLTRFGQYLDKKNPPGTWLSRILDMAGDGDAMQGTDGRLSVLVSAKKLQSMVSGHAYIF